MAAWRCGNSLRGAFCDDAAAAGTAFGTQIDDPVGRLDNIQVVLDNDHAVAMFRKTMQHAQKQTNILEVQAGCRFVQNVEGTTGVTFGKF